MARREILLDIRRYVRYIFGLLFEILSLEKTVFLGRATWFDSGPEFTENGRNSDPKQPIWDQKGLPWDSFWTRFFQALRA